jgi:1-acyl-sn-glycerol-3-phosphate acyltransferase
MAHDAWRYDTASDFGLSLVERLRRVPREPDMLVSGARLAIAVALRAALRAGCRPEITGLDHLPREGSFVLVANHASHLDAALLLSLLPLSRLDRAYPLAASDYFYDESVARTVATTVAFNILPIERGAGACRAFKVCRELLADGRTVLVVFPEGTRSPDGSVGDFKPGAGLLLAGLGVPVVPCHLGGTHRAWPKGARLPRPHRVRVAIGRPRDYAHLERSKASALAICEDLRATVLELSEGAFDVYDPRRDRDDPHSNALGRYRDLLSRLASRRATDASGRPLSSRT